MTTRRLGLSSYLSKKMIKLTWEQMGIGNEAESRLVCEDSECTLFEGVTSISI